MRRITAFLLCALFTLSASALSITTATFNIRLATKDDGINYWNHRKKMVIEFLQKEQPDIFGTQEVLHQQLQDLQEGLKDYGFVGVGREDGKEKGEYSALFYLKKRFKVIQSNTFWLHEDTSAVGQKGWDAACERIVTWALMEEIKTGKRFYFFNTHFDHVGVRAQEQSALLIVNKIKEKGNRYPVILVGDFNTTQESKVYTTLTSDTPSLLKDSRKIASKVEGPAWSFHDFGRIKEEQRVLIDYVFVTDNVTVKSYRSIFKENKGVYLSDHNPLLVNLDF